MKSVCSEWVAPSRSGRPISPAIAPESSIALSTMPRASTPLALAADGERPLALQVEAEPGALEQHRDHDADHDASGRKP